MCKGLSIDRDSLRADEQGATMVEFVFTAAAFFMLIVVTFEAAILGFRSLSVQYVASRTAREIALFSGNEGTGDRNITFARDLSENLMDQVGLGVPQGNVRDPWRRTRRSCARWARRNYFNSARLRRFCENLPPAPSLWDDNVQFCEMSRVVRHPANPRFGECLPNPGPTGFFGDPGDFVVVRIVYPTKYFFQMMRLNVIGWAAARNEE